MIAMPPDRKSKQPRSYGRQADGRTIKSLSMAAHLVDWAEKEASRRKISFSALIEEMLQAKKEGVPFALIDKNAIKELLQGPHGTSEKIAPYRVTKRKRA